MKIKNIDDVAAYQLCCGCGACAYTNPETFKMTDTLEFGRRPLRISTETDSGDAFTVCPGRSLEHGPEVKTPGLVKTLLPGWGPILDLWEGWALDEEVRFKGSSGGATTALSLFALEKAGLSGVLHVAPRTDIPYLNQTVLSRSRDDIMKAVGSRYAPASPCDGLFMIEQTEGRCIVIGKPCDIAAVHKIVALKPVLKEKIALTISVFCAGTPSNKGVLAMLNALGATNPASVLSVRYRGYGWPGATEIQYKNGGRIETKQMTYEQSWGSILQKFRQWRCYICPDHTGEFADISVGDPWYRSDRGINPGQSLILARTERGRAFLEAASAAHYLTMEKAEADKLPASQPSLLTTRGSLWARLFTLRLFGVPVPVYTQFPLFIHFIKELSFLEKVKIFFKTAKRIFIKKLGHRQKIESFKDFS